MSQKINARIQVRNGETIKDISARHERRRWIQKAVHWWCQEDPETGWGRRWGKNSGVIDGCRHPSLGRLWRGWADERIKRAKVDLSGKRGSSVDNTLHFRFLWKFLIGQSQGRTGTPEGRVGNSALRILSEWVNRPPNWIIVQKYFYTWCPLTPKGSIDRNVLKYN